MRLLLATTARRLVSQQVRAAVSAAPQCTTGIEHAEELKKRGLKNKSSPKDYKVAEYLNFKQWSFYDKEIDMASSRVQQPSKFKADTLPSVKQK